MAASSIPMGTGSASVRDLLARVRTALFNDPDFTQKYLELYMSRFDNTADYMAKALGETVDSASVLAVSAGGAEFLQLLAERKRRPGTVTHHIGRRNALLDYAREFGLLQLSPIELEWKPIAEAARDTRRYRCAAAVVAYALAQNVHTYEFSRVHLNAFGAGVQPHKGRRGAHYVTRTEKAFRRLIRNGGFQPLFPAFDASKRGHPFSLFLEDMHPYPMLQADVSEIVKTMQDAAEAGEVRVGENLLSQFEALCGYAIKERGMTHLVSVDPLLTEEFLKEYVEFLMKKGCKRPAIANKLGGLHTVVYFLLRFKAKDLSWWRRLLDNVVPELKSAIRERARNRGLRYFKLLEIPYKIRAEFSSSPNLSDEAKAWLVHDCLLMAVAVMLVWDPYLIKTCRITGPSPNLFKKPIPKDRPFLALTPAAIEAIGQTEDVPLWQFDFEQEWGVGAYAIVVDQLVDLLDEFVGRHDGNAAGPEAGYRHFLIDPEKGDPGTLFLGRDNRPLTKTSLARAIGELTSKHGGKRVTPETIRNSFINHFRVKRPNDYINLANILMISLDSVLVRFDPNHKRQPDGR